MKYLLDTHTFLWFVTDNNRLSSKVENMVLITGDKKIREYKVSIVW